MASHVKEVENVFEAQNKLGLPDRQIQTQTSGRFYCLYCLYCMISIQTRDLVRIITLDEFIMSLEAKCFFP